MKKLNLQRWTSVNELASVAKWMKDHGYNPTNKGAIADFTMTAVINSIAESDRFKNERSATEYLAGLGISLGQVRERHEEKVTLPSMDAINAILDDMQERD